MKSDNLYFIKGNVHKNFKALLYLCLPFHLNVLFCEEKAHYTVCILYTVPYNSYCNPSSPFLTRFMKCLLSLTIEKEKVTRTRLPLALNVMGHKSIDSDEIVHA